MDMAVVAVELFDACKRRDEAFERIAGEIKIEGMFERRIPLVGGKNLDITPGKADQVRPELGGGIANRPAPLGDGKQGQIENTLANFRFAPMNEIGQVRNADRIDLLAWEENVKDR